VPSIVACYIRYINLVHGMSRKIILSPIELDWLKENHSDFTHQEIAERYSICIDTAKRTLMRLKLQYFPGAKYQIKPQPPKWQRPCIICGSKSERAKNQYKCDGCTEREAEASRVSSYDDEPARKKPSILEIPF